MANDNEPKNVDSTKISVKQRKESHLTVPVRIVQTKRRSQRQINEMLQEFSPCEVLHILRTYRAGRKASKAARHHAKLLGT